MVHRNGFNLKLIRPKPYNSVSKVLCLSAQFCIECSVQFPVWHYILKWETDFDFELDATDQGPRVAWFIVLWIMPKADSASFGIRIAFLLDSIAMQEKLPHMVSLLLSQQSQEVKDRENEIMKLEQGSSFALKSNLYFDGFNWTWILSIKINNISDRCLVCC